MRRMCFGSIIAILAAAVASGIMPDSVQGQEQKAATPTSLSRTPDGQPLIEGEWETDAYGQDLETGIDDAATAQIQGRAGGGGVDLANAVSVVIDPPDGKIPYQPWAQAKRLAIPSFRRGENRGVPKTLREMRPRTLCLHGPPRSTIGGFEVVQVPGAVIFVWEFSHAYRIIPLDARPRLAPQLKLAMGDARGRWEGQTLIVETTNLNDWDWFDYTGTFRSDSTTLVERFTVVDANTIDYQVTVTDPKVFTRPWTVAAPFKRNVERPADWEMLEAACVEGERGVEGIMGVDPRKQ